MAPKDVEKKPKAVKAPKAPKVKQAAKPGHFVNNVGADLGRRPKVGKATRFQVSADDYLSTAHPLPRMSLAVTSREVIWLFLEQLWLEVVPVLHRLQGGFAAQGRLGKLLVVEPDVSVQRRLQFFA